jgi:futalosine hydrolase
MAQPPAASGPITWLLVVAAPAEARAVLKGLGADEEVAGALPGSGLEVGDVVAATACIFADEGVQTPERFMDCHAMGFPLGAFEGSAVPVDPRLLGVIRPLAKAAGPVATVSTCSGQNALAATVRERTGALAEAMEGAAVGLVAHRLGAPFAELRVVSNTTGDRPGQTWDLKGALARLEAVVAVLATARAHVR